MTVQSDEAAAVDPRGPIPDEIRGFIEEEVERRVAAATNAARGRGVSIVVFSGDTDRILAASFIANTAASCGQPATMFFTFWGLSALRVQRRYAGKNLKQRLMTWMMPKGASSLGLSKMNMAGIGPRFLRMLMNDRGVPGLKESLAAGRESGVRLVACSTSLDLMGVDLSELVPGVEVEGASAYLACASRAAVTLFV